MNSYKLNNLLFYIFIFILFIKKIFCDLYEVISVDPPYIKIESLSPTESDHFTLHFNNHLKMSKDQKKFLL